MNAKLAADWNALIAAYNARLDVLNSTAPRRCPIPAGYHLDAAYVQSFADDILALAGRFLDPDAPFLLEAASIDPSWTNQTGHELQTPGDWQYLSDTLPGTAGYTTFCTASRTGITLEQLSSWLDAASTILAKMYRCPIASSVMGAEAGGYGYDWYRDNGTIMQAWQDVIDDAPGATSGSAGYGNIGIETYTYAAWTTDHEVKSALLFADRNYLTLHGTYRPCDVHVWYAIQEGTEMGSWGTQSHVYPMTPPYAATITYYKSNGWIPNNGGQEVTITAFAFDHINLGTYSDGMTFLDAPFVLPSSAMLDDVQNYTYSGNTNGENAGDTSVWTCGWRTWNTPVFLLDFSEYLGIS